MDEKKNFDITEEEVAAVTVCIAEHLGSDKFNIKSIKSCAWSTVSKRAGINTALKYAKYWR